MYSQIEKIKIVKPFILKLAVGYLPADVAAELAAQNAERTLAQAFAPPAAQAPATQTQGLQSSQQLAEQIQINPSQQNLQQELQRRSRPLSTRTLASTSLAIALPFFLSQLFTNLYSQPTIDSVQILNTIKNLYNQPSRDPFKDVFAALLRQLNSATQ